MHVLTMALRILGLTVVGFVTFAFVGSIVMPKTGQPPEEALTGALMLLIVCLTYAVALTYILHKSRWERWPRIGVLFVAFFGSTTVMTQIETAFFVATVSAEDLARICLLGAVVAAVLTLIAGFLVAPSGTPVPASPSITEEVRLLVRRLLLIVPIYLALYFAFGYFVAWQNASLREFYGGGELVGFGRHMLDIARETPWLIPFQALRAVLWALLALPVVRMTGDSWIHAGAALALLFGAVMNVQLMLPNPYMPSEVRLVHFIETASSNLIFGFLLAYLLFLPREDAAGEQSPIHRALGS